MNRIFGEILNIHIARDRWLLIGLLDAQDKIVRGGFVYQFKCN